MLATVIGLLLCRAVARAAPLDPCAPPATCYPASIHASPTLRPVAADGAVVYARLFAPGNTPARLAVLETQSGELVARGMLDLDPSGAVLRNGYLYAPGPAGGLWSVGVTNPAHPAYTGFVAAPARLSSLTAGPSALYALTPTTDTVAGELLTFSLDSPARPHLASTLDGLGLRALQVSGATLAGATVDGLLLLDLADPLAPEVSASLSLFTEPITAPVDLALHAGFAYVMAHTIAGAPLCRSVDIRSAHAPAAAGDCPFTAGRTFFAGGFAYVNPNRSGSEYLDYQIYSLADPAAPDLTGSLPHRFAALVGRPPDLFAAAPGGQVIHLRQQSNGALALAGASWDAADLEGSPRLLDAGLLYLDQGQTAEGRRVALFDLTPAGRPRLVGALESTALSGASLHRVGPLLLARRASGITLFDISLPATGARLAVVDPPPGESFALTTIGGDGLLYAATNHNLLFALDLSRPLTPTVRARLDLPGAPDHLLWAQRHLYVFEPDALSIVDTRGGDLQLVKRLPIDAPVTSAAAWGRALYLQHAGADGPLILDVADATAPHPLDAAWDPPVDGSAPVRLIPTGRDRLGALYLHDGDYTLLLLDLADPLAPRPITRVAGLDSGDLWTDGVHVLLESGHILRASEPAASAMLPADEELTFAPEPGIRYIAPPAADGSLCLRHTRISPASLPQQPPYLWHDGLFRLEIVECATGAQAVPSAPVRVEVPVRAGARPRWQTAGIWIDLGGAFVPVAGVDGTAGTLSGVLVPPVQWAILGAPRAPVALPLVSR